MSITSYNNPNTSRYCIFSTFHTKSAFILLFVTLNSTSFARAFKQYRCRSLRSGSEFLLDNSVTPTVLYQNGTFLSFDEVYELRKAHGLGTNIYHDSYRALLSDMRSFDIFEHYMMKLDKSHRPTEAIRNPYQKLRNMSDLLNEFNNFGFHDICNTLRTRDVEQGVNKYQMSYVPPGYQTQNASVANTFELLMASENDVRFGQFVNCFQLLFSVSSLDIESEFRTLKRMIKAETTRKSYIDFDAIERNYTWMDKIQSRNDRYESDTR